MRRPSLPVTAVAAALVLASTLTGCGTLGFGAEEPADIQVYTGRHYDLEQAFKDFESETGLSVEFLSGDDAELLERLKAEGDETPADVFMTVDAGNLWKAAEDGELAPLESTVLDRAVPDGLKDPQNRWVGLSMRARTVMYNPDQVDPSEFDTTETYAGLTDPTWQGRLCMRDSTNSYTQSLVASLIDKHGYDGALEIVGGWVGNDVEIMSNDILLLEALDAGKCDAAITNHYYLGRMLEEDPDLNVKPFWANQDGDGVHVNVSGAGVIKNSDSPKKAQRLIEYLAAKGQNGFVDANHEFPVNPTVEPEPLIAGFGEFDYAPINAEAYGELNAKAVDLMAEAGYE